MHLGDHFIQQSGGRSWHCHKLVSPLWISTSTCSQCSVELAARTAKSIYLEVARNRKVTSLLSMIGERPAWLSLENDGLFTGTNLALLSNTIQSLA